MYLHRKWLVAATSVVGLALAFMASAAASPTWTPAVRIAPPPNTAGITTFGGPHVAMNEAGDAVLEWNWWLGGNTAAEVMTRRRASDTWSQPVALAYGAGGDGVALDDAGDAFAVLTEGVYPACCKTTVQAAVKPALRETWDDPVTLSSTFDTDSPHLAVNASGDAVVVLSPGQAGTWRAGRGAWEAATDISQGSYFRPDAVAIDSAGNELAMWARSNENGSEVVEASFRPVGSPAWEPPVDLGGPYSPGQNPAVGEIRVAFDGAGNAVTVWSTPDRLWGSYRPFGGSWQQAVNLGLGTRGALNLSVASNGNALAVEGPAGYVYSVTRSAASGRWTALSLLPGSEGVTGFEDDVALGTDKAGDAVALWIALGAGKDVVLAALRPADVARWTEPVDLGSYFAAGFPTVAVDGHGDALAAWGEGLPDSVDNASELHPGGPILFSQIPSSAVAGKPVRFAVTPAAWGASLAGKPRWDFGDGSSAYGNAIKHAYRRPGVYTVAITDADASGNSTTAAGTIRIRRLRSRAR
jgi:hypothetical protein